MQTGQYVRHRTRPEWGFGVVAACHGERQCEVVFEHGGRRLFDLRIAGERLDPVQPYELPLDSPLLDPRRWKRLGTPSWTGVSGR